MGVGLRNSTEHRAGLRESAFTELISTDTTMVTANCWYNRPVMPAMVATGTNTATITSVVAITGAVTSFMAAVVACAAFMPFSMFTCTASTTTMASSTTMPMASTRPSRLSTLMLKPSIGNSMKAPTSETGMASVGIRVARQSWMKRNTTRITSSSASPKVTTISSMPAVMGLVESNATACSMPSGYFLASPAMVSSTRAARSTALLPGAWYTAISAQAAPFMRVNMR